jgi:Coenzyme PQQ synthesis protein D (PqqD)
MTVYRLRRDGLHWREIAGEAIVLDVPASLYLSANPAGTLLWNELAEGATRDRLAGRLMEEYDIARDRAERDVDAFLAGLSERGFLDVSG